VNIGSFGGLVVSPLCSSYCASKYAVEALSDQMRMEFPFPVILLEPGAFATEIFNKCSAHVPDYNAQKDTKLIRYLRFIRTAKLPPATTVVDHLEYALLAIVPPTRLLIGNDAIVFTILFSLVPDFSRLFCGS